MGKGVENHRFYSVVDLSQIEFFSLFLLRSLFFYSIHSILGNNTFSEMFSL